MEVSWLVYFPWWSFIRDLIKSFQKVQVNDIHQVTFTKFFCLELLVLFFLFVFFCYMMKNPEMYYTASMLSLYCIYSSLEQGSKTQFAHLLLLCTKCVWVLLIWSIIVTGFFLTSHQRNKHFLVNLNCLVHNALWHCCPLHKVGREHGGLQSYIFKEMCKSICFWDSANLTDEGISFHKCFL